MRALLGVAMLAACGDSLLPHDAEPSGVPDSSVGLVFVEVRGAVVQGGIPVVFQDADSSLVLSTQTDAAGHANAYMAAGGFVTVVTPDQILTYAGVVPGDTLAFEPFTTGIADAVISMRVRVPAEAGAVGYRLYSPCGSREIFGAQLQPLDVSLGACDAVTDLIAVSTTSTGAERSIFRRDVVLGHQATIEFEGAYQPELLSTISVRDVPSGITLMLASQAIIDGADEVFPARSAAIEIAGGTGASSVTMPMPPQATISTHLEAPSAQTTGLLHVIEWQPTTTDVVLSYDRDRPRSYTERPSYRATDPAVVWREDAEGLVADGVIVQVTWTDNQLGRHHWTVLAPRSSEPVVRLPILPNPVLRPLASTISVVRLDSFRLDGGYDHARSTFRLGKQLARGLWFSDAPAGRVVYQSLD
ncbi:MAG: hypothetical protein JWP01_2799 [Myxococcales bacterium]|nr:hypothetical protein [Myxococcales bacterium]